MLSPKKSLVTKDKTPNRNSLKRHLKLATYAITVGSHKFEDLGTRGFISNYQ